MNIEWKHLFSDITLIRGKLYYQEGRIERIQTLQYKEKKQTLYGYYAYGTECYKVDIKRSQRSIVSMLCECPHARDGNLCKHMAAVLFDLEESGKLEINDGKKENTKASANRKGRKSSEEKKVRVFPFREEIQQNSEEKPYRYYDLDKATEEYVIDASQLATAQDFIKRKIVQLDSVREMYVTDYYGNTEKRCNIQGVFHDMEGYKDDLQVILARKCILMEDCRVPTCPCREYRFLGYYRSGKRDMCVHILALLLLAQAYIKKNRLGDATDGNGARLMKVCRDRRVANRLMAASAENRSSSIRLEPRLDVEEDGRLQLTFRIGKEKLYVIKNLTEFVDTVETHGEWQLGTKTSVSFAADGLEESSEEFYQFIKKEVRMAAMKNAELRLKYNYDISDLKSSIPLYGRALDGFYQMMERKSFPFVEKTRDGKFTGEASCRQRSPEIKLLMEPIEDEEENFDGIQISGQLPKLVKGTDYKYFFDGEYLNRADEENLSIFDSMRKEQDGETICFKVGRRNLTEFYYRMLPVLQEIAEIEIENQQEIEKHLYPEAEFSFFLDAEDGLLSCKATVCYGNETCTLTGIKNGAEDNHDMLEVEAYPEYRDLRMEKEVLETVTEYFPEQDGNGLLCCIEEDAQYNILESGVDALMRLGEVHATDRFQRMTIRRKPQITVGVRMESDLLKLDISSTDLTRDELLDILNSYRRAKKYHRLKNGDFIRMEDETLKELSNFMELMHADPKDFVEGDMQIPAYRALYLDKLLEKNDGLYGKRDSHFKHLIKEFKTVSDSEYEIPESLQDIVRSYQEFGYKWLRTIESYRFGGILADDMGLGKTLQMISVLLAAKEEGRLGTALIVTPASLVYNWKEEFSRFAPQLAVEIAAGSKIEREMQIKKAEGIDVLITSYDLLKRDILWYQGKSFSHQVIDEAQYIKTHTTAAAKSVKAINSKIRFALTGTPIENRLSELWSIFDFLMPGFLYSYDRFRKELEIPIMKHRDQNVMKQLKRLVEPFILRRLKRDVLNDLPEKNEEVCYVHFDKKQQELYDGQVLHMKQTLEGQNEDAFQKNKMAILAEITKIRQICCDPVLCLENYKEGSAKRDACMELIRSAVDGEHKVLVFSQFRSMLELLEEDLSREGIHYFKITGETKKEDRVTLVNRFNQDDTPVFLISLKAGGTGLNLTGADIVIHYDPWWNLAAQNQATDRAHRIGQTKVVSVYKLIAKGSIEEKILKMQEDKRVLSDEILSGKTGGLMNMSKEELMELL